MKWENNFCRVKVTFFSPNMLLFLNVVLAIVGIFNFCMTFRFNYQIKKRPAVISIEITLIV